MKLINKAIVALCIIGVSQFTLATDYSIKGDLRYRHESQDKDSVQEKDRHRLRARIGVYGDVNDRVTFGTRLASGSSKTEALGSYIDASPTSTNQDLTGEGSSKNIWLDLAYFKIDSLLIDGVDATFGKMKQPWDNISDLLFDGDVNPEGISTAYNVSLNESTELAYQAGHFILENNNTEDDVALYSAQVSLTKDISESVGLKAGLSYYDYVNMASQAGKNNTAGIDFNIVQGFAELSLSQTSLPLTLFIDYAQNSEVDEEDVAWMSGVSTKSGDWSYAYNYRDVGIDSIYGNWSDSDFHGGGTGGSGHKFKVKYAMDKNLSAGATYFVTEKEDGTEVNTLQLDLVSKF